MNKPQQQKTIIFISGRPASTGVSGSCTRSYWCLYNLCALGHKVTHSFFNKADGQNACLRRLKTDFDCLEIRQELPSTEELSSYDIIWVTNFWTPDYLETLGSLLEEVRAFNPRQRIVVDLSDVLVDDYRQKNTVPLETIARLENRIYSTADIIAFVSHKECQRAIKYYSLDPAKVHTLSSFHPFVDTAMQGFGERKGGICMAGALHSHNLQAFTLGVKKIWPKIKALMPDQSLHIFGAGTERIELNDDSIKLLGKVDDFQQTMAHYKVHMVPTVSGCGVKTKVLDSLASGTPVVGTPACLEGTKIPAKGILISESVSEFAQTCVNLLQDPAYWETVHKQARINGENLSQSQELTKQLTSIINQIESRTILKTE